MTRIASPRLVALVVPLVVLPAAACGDAETPPGTARAGARPGDETLAARSAQARQPAGSAVQDEVAAESVAVEVFLREPAPEIGPGRRMLHVLVPAGASEEQVRRAMVRTLEEEAERDTALVAIRAIGYRTRPAGPNQANLFPVIWAEWLPPSGWYDATAASRDEFHRTYTYSGVPPEW